MDLRVTQQGRQNGCNPHSGNLQPLHRFLGRGQEVGMRRRGVSDSLGTLTVFWWTPEKQLLVFRLNLKRSLLLSKCLHRHKKFWTSPNNLGSLASTSLASPDPWSTTCRSSCLPALSVHTQVFFSPHFSLPFWRNTPIFLGESLSPCPCGLSRLWL